MLKFTPDGRFALAVGDDKQVIVYPVGDKGLDAKSVSYLRWPSWREQRGSLYAMDISPDGKLVAVGGYGMLNTSVAVIEREGGKIRKLVDLSRGQENFYAVNCLAFSPNGKQLAVGTGNGSVWIWDDAGPPQYVGTHDRAEGNNFNRVRAMMVDKDGTIYSLAENANVETWTKAADGWVHKKVMGLKTDDKIRCAAFHPGVRLVAAGTLGDALIVGDLKAGALRSVSLGWNRFSRSLAFSTGGDRLAVGVGVLTQQNGFYFEGSDGVVLIDPKSEKLTQINKLERTARAEAIAWNGDNLAIAGGDNHEVELWNANKLDKRVNVAAGIGSGIWRVAVSKDDRYLAFVTGRNPKAEGPNLRGTNDWRWFDTTRRRFETTKPEGVELVQPLENADGWTVKPDDKLPWQWHVVSPNKKQFPLPWDRDQDERPICYTFINPKNGPLRLAVGHYWGFSLFDISGDGPKRVRLYTGHSGQVTSIAPSDDGSCVVTASSDQTISAWSLTDWPCKNRFGATLVADETKLVVKQVNRGSPAWEMGLVSGDEITTLAVAAELYFEKGGSKHTPAEAKQAMESPQPGKELLTLVKRADRKEPYVFKSTVRTRPLWRFFPGPGREWVLWMWQGSYYDTSTSGDSLVGWLMNDPSPVREPKYFKLDQFREQFHRQDVIDELLDKRSVDAALEVALGNQLLPVNLGLNEPPAVRIERVPAVLKNAVMMRLVAEPRSQNPDFLPQRVELWINSFRAKVWKTDGKAFDESFELEPGMLRSGANTLVLQSFNLLGGRAEFVQAVENPNPPQPRAVRGAAAGIDDYSASPQKSPDGKRNLLGNLRSAVNDAKKQQELWQSQKGTYYREAKVEFLPNVAAKRDGVLKALDQIAQDAKPDDLMVLILSGHGDFLTAQAPNSKKPVNTFVFCGPNYKRDQFESTGIDHKTLYDKLAAIRCRKIVFLDACHSGEAAFNPVRALTPGGQGPIIISACDRSELAYEHEKYQNGLFTHAVLKAMGEGFKDADSNKDGVLDVRELYESVVRQMPALLRSIGKADDLQNPQIFPRQPESFPLIKR